MSLFTNLKVHRLIVPLMMFFVGVFYPVQNANAQLANVSCTPVWSNVMRFTNITVNGNSNAFSSAGSTYTGNGTNTNVSVSVLPSATVSFTWVGGLYVESTFYYGYCNVFVDWNNNGTFTDAGEWLQSNYGGTCCPGVATPPGPYSGSFVVPSTVTPGPKRMRFKFDYANNTTDPCNPYTSGWYGDFRDFTINIGYNNDAAVLGLTTTTAAPFSPGNNTIQASVKNNGLNTINSMAINYTIVAGGNTTTGTINYSTPLAGQATVNVPILTYNFPAVGAVTANVTITTVNGTTDGNPSNNSGSGLFGAGLNGTYTVGNCLVRTGFARTSHAAAMVGKNQCILFVSLH